MAVVLKGHDLAHMACIHIQNGPVQYQGEGNAFWVKRGELRIYSNSGSIEEELVPVLFNTDGEVLGRMQGFNANQRPWVDTFTKAELDGLKSTGMGRVFDHL